jgi:hypothetical protein
MVVAAQPGSEASIVGELDLIKAALLYGDEVTLLSAATTMFLALEDWGAIPMLDKMQLLRDVAHLLSDEAQADSAVDGIEKIEAMLVENQGRERKRLQAGFEQAFKPAQDQIFEDLQVILRNSGMGELAEARKKGLVRIESSDPGTATDLLASCVRSAKLAENGEPNDPEYTDRMVETFVSKLSDHLSSGREYLIFDEPIADLTKTAIAAGVFPASRGASRTDCASYDCF